MGNLNETISGLRKEFDKKLGLGLPSFYFSTKREEGHHDFYGIIFPEFDRKTKEFVDFLLSKIDLVPYIGKLEISYEVFERENMETEEVIDKTHSLAVKPAASLTRGDLSDLLVRLIGEIKHEVKNYKMKH